MFGDHGDTSRDQTGTGEDGENEAAPQEDKEEES
jgi:hypothetical protein